MRPSHLDKLPDSVQKTIYNVFINASLRDKVIFLSRLDHGNEMSYKEIGDTLRCYLSKSSTSSRLHVL